MLLGVHHTNKLCVQVDLVNYNISLANPHLSSTTNLKLFSRKISHLDIKPNKIFGNQKIKNLC